MPARTSTRPLDAAQRSEAAALVARLRARGGKPHTELA
jgi:hypothetical protein